MTEAAVFRLGGSGPELAEIAPKLGVEDVVARMGFRPAVAADIRPMDPRLFREARMGLAADIAAKPARTASARLAELPA